jgi:uncharacterized membrane protein (DUF373 family)
MILKQQDIIYLISFILVIVGLLIIIVSIFSSKEKNKKNEQSEIIEKPKRINKTEDSFINFISSIKDHPFKNLVKTFLFIFVFKKLYEKVLHKKLDVSLDSLKEYIFQKNS